MFLTKLISELIKKGELKHYYVDFYAQSKVRDREKIRASDSNNNSDENSETNENDESSAKEDVDSIFGFL